MASLRFPGARVRILIAVVTLLWSAPAAAQHILIDTVMVPTDDGVNLRTTVSRPVGAGPHPVVLFRSPYGGRRGGGMDWLAQRLVPHGYAVVEQAVRGTGGSEGAFVPFVFDARDGRTLLDWVVQQPWAGRIGLWGISYLGWSAYALAETGHPAISAMVLGSAWADLPHFFSPGGAFHLMAHVPWLIGFGPGGRGLPPRQAFDGIFRTVPLSSLVRGQEESGAAAEHPYRWAGVDVPVLHWTGWYDYIYRDVLKGYVELSSGTRRHGRDQRLIVGPWAHNGELSGATGVGGTDFGPAAAAGLDSVAAWTRRFFDHHLRGGTPEGPPVRIFMIGENRWRTFDRWPPANARRLVLHLGGGGTLVRETPLRASTTTFVYDPNNPVPTLGGVVSHFFPDNIGPLDQSLLDARSDIIRFESRPLEADLVLAGPLRAVLQVEADAKSTDITAKLVQLMPDGRAKIIEDGIRRIGVLAGGPQEVVVELGQRAMRLEAGSRLRLDVSGGNFPKFDRNPNSGEDAFAATSFQPVRIRLHFGGDRSSRIELSVLPD